jgi:hypothetical protein
VSDEERTRSCPDCAVTVGEAHDDGCDVARCLETGHQRLSCRIPHDCGADVWSGVWPGSEEAAFYGVDLNALTSSGKWDRLAMRWVMPYGW